MCGGGTQGVRVEDNAVRAARFKFLSALFSLGANTGRMAAVVGGPWRFNFGEEWTMDTIDSVPVGCGCCMSRRQWLAAGCGTCLTALTTRVWGRSALPDEGGGVGEWHAGRSTACALWCLPVSL